MNSHKLQQFQVPILKHPIKMSEILQLIITICKLFGMENMGKVYNNRYYMSITLYHLGINRTINILKTMGPFTLMSNKYDKKCGRLKLGSNKLYIISLDYRG